MRRTPKYPVLHAIDDFAQGINRRAGLPFVPPSTAILAGLGDRAALARAKAGYPQELRYVIEFARGRGDGARALGQKLLVGLIEESRARIPVAKAGEGLTRFVEKSLDKVEANATRRVGELLNRRA